MKPSAELEEEFREKLKEVVRWSVVYVSFTIAFLAIPLTRPAGWLTDSTFDLEAIMTYVAGFGFLISGIQVLRKCWHLRKLL